ncbi:hypothetical protein EFE32_11425 [Lactococcus lactis subsp. lactis]|nr:hypothetical protein [Lactococcus lactis subsp. lactis]
MSRNFLDQTECVRLLYSYFGLIIMIRLIGELVRLPETKYAGVVGTVIAENKVGILVRFNGIQEVYFKEEELKAYKK